MRTPNLPPSVYRMCLKRGMDREDAEEFWALWVWGDVFGFRALGQVEVTRSN